MVEQRDTLRFEAAMRRCGWYVFVGVSFGVLLGYWFSPEPGIAWPGFILAWGAPVYTELRWRRVRKSIRELDSGKSRNSSNAIPKNASDDGTGDSLDFD